jgi:hypothetical protein
MHRYTVARCRRQVSDDLESETKFKVQSEALCTPNRTFHCMESSLIYWNRYENTRFLTFFKLAHSLFEDTSFYRAHLCFLLLTTKSSLNCIFSSITYIAIAKRHFEMRYVDFDRISIRPRINSTTAQAKKAFCQNCGTG